MGIFESRRSVYSRNYHGSQIQTDLYWSSFQDLKKSWHYRKIASAEISMKQRSKICEKAQR